MTGEISIRLYWLPSRTEGRFLLHRRMPRAAGGRDLHEFWQSGRMGELAAMRLDLAGQSTAVWQHLLLGLPMREVTMPATPEPVVLRLLDRDGLGDAQSRSGPVCDVGGASLRLADVGGELAPAGGRLDANRFEPVASGIAPFLRQTLADLNLARGSAPPAPAAGTRRPAPGDELRAAIEPAIHLHDTRGVQIGDHNRQINRFVVSGPAPTMDFGDVLRKDSVRGAMSALLADPGNGALRRTLVGALGDVGGGWNVTARPLTLSARGQTPGFLERLLTFDVGVQVGHHNTQRNVFHYTVAQSPGFPELLRGNVGLAQSLADYLCPPAGGVGSLATLQEEIGHLVKGLPIDWDLDRNLVESPPAPGSELFVSRADGVVIGNHNQIQSTQVVDLDVRLKTSRIPMPGQRITTPEVPVARMKPIPSPSPVPGPTFTPQPASRGPGLESPARGTGIPGPGLAL